MSFIKVMPKIWLIGVTGAGAVSLALSYVMDVEWPGLAISLTTSMAGATVALFFVGRYEAGLTARVQGDVQYVWDVWMNDIKIGTLTDAQYAAMQREAMGDPRLILAQLFNLGHVLLNVAGRVCAMVPMLTIGMAAVAAFVVPDSLAEFAQTWRTVEPAALIAGLQNLFEMVALVSVVWVAFKAVSGHRFGFCNQYAKSVARMIRQQCNTPTEGDIHLTRWSRGAAERMAAAAR